MNLLIYLGKFNKDKDWLYKLFFDFNKFIFLLDNLKNISFIFIQKII
jgi:hypothetical protein